MHIVENRQVEVEDGRERDPPRRVHNHIDASERNLCVIEHGTHGVLVRDVTLHRLRASPGCIDLTKCRPCRLGVRRVVDDPA